MAAAKGIVLPGKLVIAILLCEGVGIISGLLSQNGMNNWFNTLNTPEWNPPAYLFAPVWTTLYFLMGISLWLIWKSNTRSSKKTNTLIPFFIQLFLNFCWPLLFFRFHSPVWALVDIVLLLIAIIITIYSFSGISKTAAWLMVPYAAWVSFATILNYTIWLINT